MRGLARVCLALGLVASLAAVASAQGTPIVPGHSVGDFRIGQDVPGIIAALGSLHSQDDLPGGVLTGYFWPLKRIGVIAEKTTDKVVAVVVSLDDTYLTEKGVSVGAETEAVRAAYGQEDGTDSHEDDSTMIYDKLGVAFIVDKAGALENRVSNVFVFTPGHYREIFAQ